MDACKSGSESDAAFTWVPDEFLLEHGVSEWMEHPLWLADPALSAADRVIVQRAPRRRPDRPLAETVRGTLAHAETTQAAGLSPTREAELLAAWHGRG